MKTLASHVGTFTVIVEISRAVEEMLSALEENDVTCGYGIRSEVSMVRAYDIAEKSYEHDFCYRVITDILSFTRNILHIEYNDVLG